MLDHYIRKVADNISQCRNSYHYHVPFLKKIAFERCHQNLTNQKQPFVFLVGKGVECLDDYFVNVGCSVFPLREDVKVKRAAQY